MKRIVTTFLTLLVLGCAQSGHNKFYTQVEGQAETKDVVLLKRGEEPTVIVTKSMKEDILNAVSQGYLPLGESIFNGGLEDIKKIKSQAKKIGATLVLAASDYSHTERGTYSQYIPSVTSVDHSGTVYGNDGSSGTYSGTSTIYGGNVVSNSYSQRRYDQQAVYLAKSKKPRKTFGVRFRNLNDFERKFYGRNTGAVVEGIADKSLAFRSNVLEGDLVLKVGSQDIVDNQHAVTLVRQALIGERFNLTVMRGAVLKKINVKVPAISNHLDGNDVSSLDMGGKGVDSLRTSTAKLTLNQLQRVLSFDSTLSYSMPGNGVGVCQMHVLAKNNANSALKVHFFMNVAAYDINKNQVGESSNNTQFKGIIFPTKTGRSSMMLLAYGSGSKTACENATSFNYDIGHLFNAEWVTN